MAFTRLLVLAAVAILSIAGSACTNEPTEKTNGEATPILSGPPATTFPMPPLDAREELGWVLIDGQRAMLKDYHGKVLVLDFYATWCAPCRQSIPRLSALRENYGLKGLQIVGLNVGGPDDRIKVAGFAKELNIQYPLGFPDKTIDGSFSLRQSDNSANIRVFARRAINKKVHRL